MTNDYNIESNGFAPTDGEQELNVTIRDVDDWKEFTSELETHLPIGAVNELKRKYGSDD